jgi:hypothetical protein
MRHPVVSSERALRSLSGLAYEASEYLHERWYGIRTGGLVMPDDLGNAGHAYYPISYRDLRRIMRRFEMRPGEDVFIDFGSGMGRVPIFMAMYPFRKVIGVELSGELHAIALANLERARPRLVCTNVEFVQTDARAYTIPDDASLIYFFMPFGLDVLRDVIGNVIESGRRAPRSIQILYCYPVTGAVRIADLAGTPGLRIIDDQLLSSDIRLTRAAIAP